MVSNDIDVIRGDLERLKRHYDLAVHTYDQIALADLSNALRIWAENKSELGRVLPAMRSKLAFRTSLPTKKASRILSRHEYVLAYLPGGAITRASNGEVAELPPDWNGTPGSLLIHLKPNADKSLEMAQYCVVRSKLEPAQFKLLREPQEARVNFQQWLDSEAVRVGRLGKDGVISMERLTREALIRRVANKYQGSHSRLAPDPGNVQNEDNLIVAHLMTFKWGGLPFPYFVLLKVAQDILRRVTPHVPGN